MNKRAFLKLIGLAPAAAVGLKVTEAQAVTRVDKPKPKPAARVVWSNTAGYMMQDWKSTSDTIGDIYWEATAIIWGHALLKDLPARCKTAEGFGADMRIDNRDEWVMKIYFRGRWPMPKVLIVKSQSGKSHILHVGLPS